jgi:hypothetical protein
MSLKTSAGSVLQNPKGAHLSLLLDASSRLQPRTSDGPTVALLHLRISESKQMAHQQALLSLPITPDGLLDRQARVAHILAMGSGHHGHLLGLVDGTLECPNAAPRHQSS